MYSPKIYPEQVEKLYRIKCATYSIGAPQSMVDMVAEALQQYLPVKERTVNKRAREKGVVVIDSVLQQGGEQG